MIELLTSDAAILVFSSVGLAVTAVSIVRDTWTQRERAVVAQLPVVVMRREKRARRPKAA